MKTYECHINNCYPIVRATNIVSALKKLLKNQIDKKDKSIYLEIRIKERKET